MNVDIIALDIVHEFLGCGSLDKGDASAALIGSQVYIQDQASTYEVDDVLVRRTVRKILSEYCPLFQLGKPLSFPRRDAKI